jgi:hypothetical protein
VEAIANLPIANLPIAGASGVSDVPGVKVVGAVIGALLVLAAIRGMFGKRK